MKRLSLELKIILSVVLFTLIIVGLQRYLLSKETYAQFFASKKLQNELLINTIAPIVTLNLSLGLEGANREYLDNIATQNPNIRQIKIVGANDAVLYLRTNAAGTIDTKHRNALNFCQHALNDTLNGRHLGTVFIDYSEQDLKRMESGYRETTFKILFLTLISMVLFLLFLRNEFKHLKELSDKVLSYDPAEHNLPIRSSRRGDEVGIIQNAIVKMIKRINAYATLLDETNKTLEAKVVERTKELEIANRKLEQLSATDALTGLPNRRSFDRHFDNVWELAKRKQLSVAVILCDIDHFKKVNDAHGHLAGDIVLKAVAQILQSVLKRSTDFTARYGGEEFIMILPDADAEKAEALCREIQLRLRGLSIRMDEHTVLGSITFSFGISALIPSEDVLPKYVIKQADDALYLAKENGRDAIRCYQGPICL